MNKTDLSTKRKALAAKRFLASFKYLDDIEAALIEVFYGNSTALDISMGMRGYGLDGQVKRHELIDMIYDLSDSRAIRAAGLFADAVKQ